MSDSADIVKETYAEGDYIFFEGDLDYHFYIVEKGLIEIFTKSSKSDRVKIALLGEGESFGEFALLDRQSRSASAQAMSPCVLVKVSEKGYQQLLQDLPPWASAMLKSFALRLKAMNERLKENAS